MTGVLMFCVCGVLLIQIKVGAFLYETHALPHDRQYKRSLIKMNDCGGLKIPEDDSKVPEPDIFKTK